MAQVIVTLRIMPESPSTNLEAIEAQAKEKIEAFAGKTEYKTVIEPVAFGLKSLNLTFVMSEEKGSTEELEKDIASIPELNSVEVTDVRRAIG